MSDWHADWAWSLPLIVLNVVIHVLDLRLKLHGDPPAQRLLGIDL